MWSVVSYVNQLTKRIDKSELNPSAESQQNNGSSSLETLSRPVAQFGKKDGNLLPEESSAMRRHTMTQTFLAPHQEKGSLSGFIRARRCGRDRKWTSVSRQTRRELRSQTERGPNGWMFVHVSVL